ncbi:ABC transporter substrate-binding protein [Corticibacterium sp. UT-5YL-CI-8]|nr:ABC transporter substrate-binding protein [Tianweitania sp. UT-5YL-CI-8]
MIISRRAFLGTTLAGAGTFAMPAILRAAPGDTVHIGVITTLSGGGQIYGNYIKAGAEIAAKRLMRDGALGGAKIELVVRDDRNTPDGAVTAFREIAGSGVKLFAQGNFTANLLGTLPLLKETGATMMMVGPSSLALTHEAFNPQAFRIGYTSPMAFGGYGTLMAKRFPDVQKWAMTQSDVTALNDITRSFAKNLKEEAAKAGRTVEVLDPVKAMLNASDFRAQISQIMGSGAGALFNCFQGADAISFFKQARGFNVEGSFKPLCDSGNELEIAKAMGANTPASLWSWTGWYYGTKDSTISQDAVALFKESSGNDAPSAFFGFGHDAIVTLISGMEKAGSEETAALVPAIEANAPEGCLGKLIYRKEDHTFAGKLSYINFGRDEKNPKGWSVIEVAQLEGADFLEEATPGRKLN